MKNIGIDIGGTFIKGAIVEENGEITASLKLPTPDGGNVPKKVLEVINLLLDEKKISLEQISSVGIGVPGICNSKDGIIVSCANIKNCVNIEICSYIEEETGKPVFIDNDANCAALGEYMLSEEKKSGFIFVTLGTGVGGGIILDGKILRGINSAAGEIGHIVIDKNGERCNCGRYGCWERYASVSALVRQSREAGFTGNVSGKTIFAEMDNGSEKAKKVIDKWLCYVAEGICDMVNIFQPDEIVIGGGISREGDKILDGVKSFVEENSIIQNNKLPKTQIKISKLFNDAGVVGASFLYTQK